MKIEKSAIVIATGNQVRVYKSKFSPVWVNAHDFVTKYNTSELKFVDAHH